MRNRLSKMRKAASWMLVLLAVGGATTSCKDEYKLDDEKPSWLSSSIYSSLEERGNFTNYLRLLGDPDVNPANARPLTEVLSRTGSKTVFVANDDAWNAFFEKNKTLPEANPWHTATSYENLSMAQKKLLIHTSMLNNAIVMENLATAEESAGGERGNYLRHYTDIMATDSITKLDGNSLPVNYNTSNGETDYWARFRAENGGKGLYLMEDSGMMMVHFTQEYMAKNSITDQDFSAIVGEERVTNDVHIGDAKIVEQNGVCENGYTNITSHLLTPLPSMAEMIRSNGKTNIFAHMLDRWSAPFYNKGVTEAYRVLARSRGEEFAEDDSIFVKRYFSDMSWGHTALAKDPYGEQFKDSSSTDVGLKFDPAWNAYYDESAQPQMDMAAMYVPNDETMWKYFTPGGGGWQLIDTYCDPNVFTSTPSNPSEADYEMLYRNIDQIPISTLRSLINIIMFKSFASSVPSKMTKLRDDAQEPIFYPEDREHITSSLLANNGVVYITDKVYGPADYTSVAAPAYISKDNLVVRWAIYNGSTTAADLMGLNYYAYLKAMQSRFVFFLPSDKAMRYYYDTPSFKSQKSRVLAFAYSSRLNPPIKYEMYDFNSGTGEIGKSYNLENLDGTEITNRLKDVLESHTIVLDGRSEINSDVDEYYITKNGSAVKVTREGGKITKVQGGFQLENEQAGITGTITSANKDKYTEIKGIQENNVTSEQDMNNGTTYLLDSPIIPPSKSVYNVVTSNGQGENEYTKFYELCQPDEDIIRACGLVNEKGTTSQQKQEIRKYRIFTKDNCPDQNVQFFNNYRYTVLVPTNDAIDEAVSKGLPTWESIKDYFEAHKDSVSERPATKNDSIVLQTMITYLTNFVRYHFADNSVFVDNSTFGATDYVTASYDNQKELFCKINFQRPGAKHLQVKDACGGPWLSCGGEGNTLPHNILARDITCSKSPAGATTMNKITIQGSNFAVIHQIPGVLNHMPLVGGRYDSTWATLAAAKRYLKRFGLH